MVKIELYLDKTIEQNAALYYDKAKKMKAKAEGAKEALAESEKRLEKAKKEQLKQEAKQIKQVERKKEWFEKFRWFYSSEGFLVIGGRDATTNEIVIKKHTDKDDIVFHTDMAGSPFFVIKIKDKKPGKETLKQVADATVSFSKAWKNNMTTTPVFYVKPDQVTKEAQAGEYLAKGAFMIRGKTSYIDNNVNLAVGALEDGKIMCAPIEAVKKHCKDYVEIKQGRKKASTAAKHIQNKLKQGSLDEIIRVMPSGGLDWK